MDKTLVLLLAGGVGSRLNILASERAKPAVPFGGIYRIIDFTLSNAMNSGLSTVGVLTQYKPLSLMQHIGTGEPWDFIGRTRGAKILPPRTGQSDSDWYKGTADAVRQNIDFIESHGPDFILVLSGDHIYKMDYADLLRFHSLKKAKLTIGMMEVPWENTRDFGIAITDKQGRVVDWEEKPVKARNNLASMGIYVFNATYLLTMLRKYPEHDFGKHIIPAALKQDRVYAYPFQGYWRDVGTIEAYWRANMDLLDCNSGLDLSDWRVRTHIEEEDRLGDREPTSLLPGSRVRNSVISPGCIIAGRVENSILSPGVRVGKDATVLDSVIMHDCDIDAGAKIQEAILDKKVHIGAGTCLGGRGNEIPNKEKPDHLSCGLILVGKGSRIPGKTQIGRNSILYPNLTPVDFKLPQIPAGSTLRPNGLRE